MAQPEAHEELLTLTRVQTMAGMSRTRVYEAMKAEVHPFPKPIKVGGRSLWVLSEVQAWIRGTIERAPRMGAK